MKGDADDVALLARGDADSFAEFYRRHARHLAGRLMWATGDAEAAADLTAETFAAALAGRKRYRPDRAAPAIWLYGIAAHKLTDWRRRGHRGRGAGGAAPRSACGAAVAACGRAAVRRDRRRRRRLRSRDQATSEPRTGRAEAADER
jgi:DNA-directed RNA polymerase specialized sigma24 family protein